jgi:asparagine synthase (glutamine-hydrolysing)
LLPGIEQRAVLPNDAWLPLLAVAARHDWALWNLRGHHAYAVVDDATGELVLGRDGQGEKPLFCLAGERGDVVAFGSTPPALQHLGARAMQPGAWFGEWFRFGWSHAHTYELDERQRLIAARNSGPCTAAVEGRAWLSAWGDDDACRLGFRVPASDLRDELCASVRRCTDTNVPVALSLSGGLDSSCLAAALHANGRRVPAYQLRVAGARAAERDAATAVAARAQLELRPVDVGTEVLDALPFLTGCAGLPLGDPSVLAVHALARAAAGDGIRVLLSGEGADELFFGYRRYRALAHLPRARWLRPFAPRWSMRYAARWLRAVAAPDPIAALLAVTPPGFGADVLSPELGAQPCWRDDAERAPGQPASPTRANLAIVARAGDFEGYLRCDLLPKVDVACMAAGVEARCPYLEGNFARRPGTDVRQLLGKRALREAFAHDLPREVLRLPKTGFALPLDRWFRGELPWLDLLAEPKTRQRAHLRPGGVAAVVDRHRRGRADLGHGLYLLVAFELFLRAAEGGRFCTRERTDTGRDA